MLKQLVALSACCISLTAMAGRPNPPKPGWDNQLGIFAFTTPKFPGSDHYKFLVVPDLSLKYRPWFFFSAFRGLGVNLIHSKKIKAGLGVKYDFSNGRDRSEDYPGLNDVNNLFSGYVFAKYSAFPFNAGIRVSHGLSRLDLGTRANLSAGMSIPVNKQLMFTVTPNVTLADNNYMRTYYGIDAAQSTSSGLREYKAHPGLTTAAVNIGAFYQFTPKWSVAAMGIARRYVGSAANSPIVKGKTDFFGGVGCYYHFGQDHDTSRTPR